MFCLEPLLLAGYLLTVPVNHYHTTNIDSPIVEIQTCERGLGAHVKAATSNVYMGGVHYGLQYQVDEYTLTVQPFTGLSYAANPIHELPQQTQFEVGVKLMAGIGKARVAIEYLHLSNAHMEQPNIGLDLIALQTGWRF
jgi:hypothetical protein